MGPARQGPRGVFSMGPVRLNNGLRAFACPDTLCLIIAGAFTSPRDWRHKAVANATSPKDQWIQVIEEYLTTAEWCIDTSKGAGIRGYSATLLLLCVTDAMGHGLLPDNGRSTRLDVLMYPPFDPALNLNASKVGNLVSWYRNMLAHTGTMSPNVFLEPDEQGVPFSFDGNDALNVIRVPVLYQAVKAAWEGRDKSIFICPSMHGKAPPDPTAQPPGFISSLSTLVSGGVW